MDTASPQPPRIGITGLHTYGARTPKFRQYADHVRAAGGIPILLGTQAHRLPVTVDGLLLAGGEDVDPGYYGETAHSTYRGNRRRDHSEFALATEALDVGMPIFAICRGAQLLNVVLGGSLVQDIPSQVTKPLAHSGGTRHPISVAANSRLAELIGGTSAEVNSYHHQSVARLASGMLVNAQAPDGTVEGWEPIAEGPHEGYLMAVQWHPERAPFDDPISRPLFHDFVEAASRFAAISR
jgi:putative glutamine amidotransferase